MGCVVSDNKQREFTAEMFHAREYFFRRNPIRRRLRVLRRVAIEGMDVDSTKKRIDTKDGCCSSLSASSAKPMKPLLTLALSAALLAAGCAIRQQKPVATRAKPIAPSRPTTMYGSELAPPSPAPPSPTTGSSRRDIWTGYQLPADQPTEGATPVRNAPLTLEHIEQQALAHHPAVKQAEAAIQQALGVHEQVGLAANPSVGYFVEEAGNEGGGGLHGVFAAKTFVRGDKLAWSQEVIGHDVQALQWELETQRQRVLTDVRIRYYRVLAAQQQLKLAKTFRQDAENAVAIARNRLLSGDGARPDLLQSEILLNQIELAIEKSAVALDGAWQELAAVSAMEWSPAPLTGELKTEPATWSADSLYEFVIANSPQLRAAQQRVLRAQANQHRQQVQAIPNVNAQLDVGHNTVSEDEFASLQLSLPLPLRNANQGNIRAAQAQQTAAAHNVQRLQALLRRQTAELWRKYNTALVAVKRYEASILPRAEESLKLIEQARRAGDVEFLRVLNARRTYFDLQREYIASLGELAELKTRMDGWLLAGGLDNAVQYGGDDGLRGRALGGL